MATDPPPSTDTTSLISSTTDQIIFINLPIFTKLNNTNYLIWKSQIMLILHGYNLLKFIENPPPSQTIIGQDGSITINHEFLPWHRHEFLPWHRQDQLILGWIWSSLTKLIQAQVVSCITTSDLWSTLSNTFSSSS
jgi:hypothetical protein